MSIVNAFIYPDRGIVYVDTDCVDADGRHWDVSKIFPLPHLPAVIAFRGSIAFQAGVVARAMVTGADFDDLANLLPGLLAEASAVAIEIAPRVSMTAELAGTAEAVIVGFSAAMSRVVAHRFKRETLADTFVATLNVGSYVVAPCWDDIGADVASIHRQVDRDGMKALAFTQARLLGEREPSSAAGGRLIITEITRSGMTIESVCSFPARACSVNVLPEG